MNRFVRRSRVTVILAALAVGVLSAPAPFAAASESGPSFKIPFKDPYIHGWLTFCNRNNQPVTSGSVYTVPFVWKAISSAPPPHGYGSPQGRATLYGYQPLPYINPGDWAGYAITSATAFSNTSHPVAQATNADQPLISFTSAFPLHWDGLAEIRMSWTAVNQSSITFPYAAAIVRVTGSRWTLIKGGTATCTQGTGVSDETRALPKKELAKKQTAAPAPDKSQQAGGSSAAGGSGGSGHNSSGSSAGGSGSSAGGAASLASADPSSGLSSFSLAGIALGALALVWAAIGGIAYWRRRRAQSA